MTQSNEVPQSPPLFPIGLLKLTLLGLGTLSLYQILWFFYHWQYLRDVRRERIRPAARSLFALFFVFPLAWRVGKEGVAWDTGGRVLALFAATAWAGLFLLSSTLPQGPLALLGLSPLVPIVALQAMANRVNRKAAPGHDGNSRLTRGNLVVICLGGLFLLAGIVSLFLPDSEVVVEERF